MRAFKCDRCNEFYESEIGNVNEFLVEADGKHRDYALRFLVGYATEGAPDWKPIDVCRNCARELFMRGPKFRSMPGDVMVGVQGDRNP